MVRSEVAVIGIGLTGMAWAHLLPDRVEDPAGWAVDGERRVSTPEWTGGSRVAGVVRWEDAEPPILLEARGRDGGRTGPWVPVEVTFRQPGLAVMVADLGGWWAGAELSTGLEVGWSSVAWEQLDPAYPDAGRRSRAAPPERRARRLRSELAAIGVISREEWGARSTQCTATEDDWYRMAIHHTAGNQTSGGTVQDAVQALQAYAMDSGEYCDIPYQFLVGYDGSLWEARPLTYYSGATGGGNNDGNIAVCFLGCYHPSDCPNGVGDAVTEAMMDGGQLLVQTLCGLEGIPSDADSIRGHRDWPDNATACPGDWLYARLDELRAPLDEGEGTPPTDTGDGDAPDTASPADTAPPDSGTPPAGDAGAREDEPILPPGERVAVAEVADCGCGTATAPVGLGLAGALAAWTRRRRR